MSNWDLKERRKGARLTSITKGAFQLRAYINKGHRQIASFVASSRKQKLAAMSGKCEAFKNLGLWPEERGQKFRIWCM